MAVSVNSTVTIARPLADVLAAVRDIAAEPQWWPGMVSATVLETDEDGRVTRARIVNDLKIVKDDFELAYRNADTSQSWTLVKPSLAQKHQEGSWTLTPQGDRTQVTISLTVDTSLPMPGILQRKLVGDQAKGACRGLAKHLGG